MKKEPLIKELIVALVFIGLIAFAAVNTAYVKRLTTDICELTEKSIEAAESGDWSRAIELASQACREWSAAEKRTSVALKHQSIENANVALALHLGLITDHNAKEAQGSRRGVDSVMRGIRELEIVRLGSVF